MTARARCSGVQIPLSFVSVLGAGLVGFPDRFVIPKYGAEFDDVVVNTVSYTELSDDVTPEQHLRGWLFRAEGRSALY